MKGFISLTTRIFCFLILAILMYDAHPVDGQTITGSVRGTVTESSGAVVQGAAVKITNVNTGISTATHSDHSGFYTIQFLPIGSYKLEISSSGFSDFQVGPFDLGIDKIVDFNAALKVQGASNNVNVSSDATPVLETQSPTLGATLSFNELNNLPNNGLNFSALTLFVPGAVTTSLSYMTGYIANFPTASAFDTPQFNGNRGQSNSYIQDGVEINQSIDNRISYNLAPAATQEIRVITGNADAEYGNASGGEVILVTKGGSNSFHGSVYNFLRNDSLDANSLANNISQIPKSSYTQNQFGATFGGPVIKNKLFLFADYEGFRYHSGGAATASVPTSQMRTGDLSQLLSVKKIQLYNTQDGFTPYANNQIPITNPVATFLFAHPEIYPLPNNTPLDGLTQNDYIGYSKTAYTNDQGDLRGDYAIGPKDSLMVRFSQDQAVSTTAHPVLAITFPQTSVFPFQSLVLNEVHTFGQSFVNEFRAGYMRVNGLASGATQDSTGLFGKMGDSVVGIPYENQPYEGFSLMKFSGSDATNIGSSAVSDTIVDNTIEYGDDIIWEHGNHVTKFGLQFVRYQQNYAVPGNNGALGNFSYSGQFTSNPTSNGAPSAGFPFADFVLDEGVSAGVGGVTGLFGERQWRDAYYVQDDWKLRHNLTINLGVRYAYDQPTYEVHNRQVSVNLSNPSLGPAGVELAGQNGNSRALYNANYTAVMPRLGASWQALPRLVVRMGYGITDNLEGGGVGTRFTQNPPFEAQFSETTSTPNRTSGGSPIRVENGFMVSTGGSLTKNTQYNIWAPNIRPAFVQQYNLSAQFELNHTSSLQAGYVGQIGQHLLNWENFNQWPSPCTASCSNAPFYNLIGQTGYLSVILSEAVFNYNALQVVLKNRLSQGLEYSINYTWSKTMTDAVGIQGLAGVDANSVSAQNAYNLIADYGPAAYDTRQNFTATAVYDLPFGRGRKFGTQWNRLLDSVAGGWKTSGVVIAYSGFPITITSNNNANLNAETARADQYLPLHVVNHSIKNWFGTDSSARPCTGTSGAFDGSCAYGPELPNQLGTARVGTERGPRFTQIDLSVSKDFTIWEAHKLQFRTDFFNALNIASYAAPVANISSTTFGQISATATSPRQIQFSTSYRF
ncbi:TonB-dependent receptor [Acidicapsa ligni]|uniref:TonB-dependent receptor n=1 Tax=Acidicapsa ligni TaxID=542300 RepID=UPI0021E02046|nr:carboxypeptidase regulatory-like domain-containing protein [Acidicapsa ligni]